MHQRDLEGVGDLYSGGGLALTRSMIIAALVNTHAIAAHFSFSSQVEVMRTDLLSRYRAYARENVCSS